MKRVLICLVSLLLALMPLNGLAAGTDYTVAEKLFRQIDAGSGFRGTLTLEVTAPESDSGKATTTEAPIAFDVGYIAIKQSARTGAVGEKRLTLALQGEASPLLEISATNARAAFTGQGFDNKWYSLGNGEQDAITLAAGAALSETSMPALLSYIAPILLLGSGDALTLSETLDPYLTKIDLWLEGYRQSAQMGKLENGTSTMEVSYQIPELAVKAQLKQLVMDAMADEALLTILKSYLSEDDAALMLNPALLDFYFSAVDALALGSEMRVERAYTLTGDTLSLRVELPMYDKTAGEVKATYERAIGEKADDPDTELLTLESKAQKLSVRYQVYQTMTGTSVYQGAVRREYADGQEKPLAISFTLSHQQAQSVSEDGKDVLTHTLQFGMKQDTSELMLGENDATQSGLDALAPVTPIDADITITFTGRNANNASTQMDLAATVTSESLPQTLAVSLTGKTVTPWSPSAVSDSAVISLGGMETVDRDALLLKAAVSAVGKLLPSLRQGDDLKELIAGFIK